MRKPGDLIDRGAKKRTDLFFLNNTAMPSILIEVCFVNSVADADAYGSSFGEICDAIASVLGGAEEVIEQPPGPGEPPGERPPRPERPPVQPATVRIDFEVTGNVTLIVNGVPVASGGRHGNPDQLS